MSQPTNPDFLEVSNNGASPINVTSYAHATVVATVTKAFKEQRLGIGLVNGEYGPKISSIVADGLFHLSNLRVGMRLLSINSVQVNNISHEEAVQILKAAEGQVIIVADEVVPPKITFNLYKSATEIKAKMGTGMPTLLSEAGVPCNTCNRIYTLIEGELLPAAMASSKQDYIYNTEMDLYTSKQMGKGYVGWGLESSHERKVFMMVSQKASLERNVDLVATQVKDRANAMLAKYNIMATFAFKKEVLAKYSSKQTSQNEVVKIIGLQFHPIE